MKALALRKSTPGLHLVDLPEPKLTSSKQVLVKMVEVGICIPCRLQPPQQDYCQTGQYTEHGIHKRHGFLTEFISEDEDMLVKVPTEATGFAVLTEPVSILEKAMDIVRLQLQHVPWGCSIRAGKMDEKHWGSCKKALVFGLGQIGFSAFMLLKLEGIDVAVLGRRDESDRTVQLSKRGRYEKQGSDPPRAEGCGCLLAPIIGALIATIIALYGERIEKLFTRTSATTQPPAASVPQEPQ